MTKMKFLLIVVLVGCVLFSGFGFSAAVQPAASCDLDFSQSIHTCQYVDAIQVTFTADSALAEIDLSPTGPYQRVRFDIHYGMTPSGWTVNIGDSRTNNGYAGDGATQSNDAELQIAGTALTIYGNDYTPPSYTLDGVRQLWHDPQFLAESRDVSLELGDGYLRWDNGQSQRGAMELPYLFALNGQPDREGPTNYTIYAGFNRVVSGSAARAGSGVTHVTITLLGAESAVVSPAADPDTCEELRSRLAVGQPSRVVPGMISDVRTRPALDGKIVGQLAGGTQIDVLDGPVCRDGYAWWYVSSGTLTGWTAEVSLHWLEPLAPAAAPPTIPAYPLVYVSPTPISTSTPSASTSVKKGLTWGLAHHNVQLEIDRVHCYGSPRLDGTRDGLACEPYVGDTSCTAALPILCLKPENLPRPNYEVPPLPSSGYALPSEAYNGWTGGHIGLTEPVRGTDLTSLERANALCAEALGEGYRMAEHHDGWYVMGMGSDSYYGDTWPTPSELHSGGWGWFAYGNLPGDTRFWVHINDQRANCWN